MLQLAVYTQPSLVDVRSFGAALDGVTDDAPAFTAALAASQHVYFPPTSAGARLASGITIPAGSVLYSDCFLPGNPVVGSRLIFDLAVATCLTIIGAASNNTAAAYGFTVTRAAGAIPAGSVGILVSGGYNIALRDLMSTRHAKCWRFLSADGVNGISANGFNLHSTVATDVHWEFDGWPEFRCTGGRSGQNGAGDVVNNGYIRFQGGTGSGGSGPNTINFTNYQFNQGAAAAGAWLIFNHPAGPTTNALEFRFVGCHVENVSAGISSDASTALINRLQIIGCTYNAPGTAFFSLNAATQPSDWEIADNQIFATLTLAPTPQITALDLSGNVISGAGSITGAANSLATLSGNTWQAGLTLAGAGWGKLSMSGDNFTSGSLTLTATGAVSINLPGQYFSWTPGITFGGAAVGVTFTRQAGQYCILDNQVIADYSIILSSKGSSVGAAQITSLPIASNNTVSAANQAHVPICSNMAGLTGAVKAAIGQGASVIALFQSSATGDVTIADTAFTNTSTLAGQVTYLL